MSKENGKSNSTISRVVAWTLAAITSVVLVLAVLAKINNGDINNGENALLMLSISLTLAAFVWANNKLRKYAGILLSISAIGVIIGAVLFISYATTTVVDGTDSVDTDSSQGVICNSLDCSE